MNSTIELNEAIRQQLIESLKRYADEEMDTEIGDLKAMFLLDYILEQVGPHIYNQALSDMATQLSLKVSDAMDALYKEPPVDKRKRGA